MDKTVKISYLLSEAGRKASLLAGGDGKELQEIETPVTPKILALSKVDSEGNTTLMVGYSLKGILRQVVVSAKIVQGYNKSWRIEKSEESHCFDVPQTVETLVAWEGDRQKMISAAKVEFASHADENKEIERQEEAVKTERRRLQAEREASWKAADEELKEKKAAKQEAYEADRAAWVEKNGSEYLKKALKMGYKVNSPYVDERASIEYPDFQVARDGWDWDERINPSMKMLDEVAKLVESGIDAEIVWLKDMPGARDDDGYHNFDPCEAVVIHEYLGKYELIKF